MSRMYCLEKPKARNMTLIWLGFFLNHVIGHIMRFRIKIPSVSKADAIILNTTNLNRRVQLSVRTWVRLTAFTPA